MLNNKKGEIVQKHLSYQSMTDYGCFYTPQKFVDHLIKKIKSYIPDFKNFVYLDSSSGYGSFLQSLKGLKTIGCDIDAKAVEVAKSKDNQSKYYCLNTLHNFSRESVFLKNNDKLIIIGNPPYNDTTSKVKQDLKNDKPCDIDSDLKTRDLGISFMLSYNKLKADYVAVLHPLSYMIKKTNYQLMKPFYDNYTLQTHSIVNSQEFSMTSKTRGFPIIIALYKRDKKGLSFETIENLVFETIDNKKFNLKLDSIKNYVSKYPSKNKQYNKDDILFFTMRDINALNRSKTFIQNYGPNSIVIDKSKFAYYCYVDVFKKYIHKLPYYYGNNDVFIDNKKFEKLKDVFITYSIEHNPWLKDKNINYNYNNNYALIDNYFCELFGGK